MTISEKKLVLIKWIVHLQDEQILDELLELKKRANQLND